MTGDLVKAMRHCPQPVIAAVDGVCAGAGRDPRHGVATCATARRARRRRSSSCASASPAATWAPARMLPRIIGQGRAAELLYTGRSMSAEEGARMGLLQPASPTRCCPRRMELAHELAAGPDLRRTP